MQLTTQEKKLAASVRERIASGFLPRMVTTSVGAGRGTGAICSLCEQAIDPQQIEYELAEGRGRFRFHMRCHAIWRLTANSET